MSGPALQVFAGPAARARLAERGLQAADVGLIPAAAGGPKGLVLNALDRHLFGRFLAESHQPVHLVGASIGAWRMAAAASAHGAEEVAAAFERLAEAYVAQRYDPEPGQRRLPAAAVTARFQHTLQQQFGGAEARLVAHPRWRLHLVTSRGLGVLARESRWRTPLGYLAAFAANAAHRPWMGRWLERVVFSDPRSPLPLPLSDYRSRVLPLTERNLLPALLASCSIPFYLRAQSEIPGAPPGAYWDGGITDYHLHWDYRSLAGQSSPLVLYPHFQRAVVPGWLDKTLRHRHRASAFLSQTVVVAPHPAWVARLPGGKLPDRADFATLSVSERQGRWRQVVAESERLAAEFERLTQKNSIQAEAL
ncbi:patatin-like phospholipase family protein [Inhella gelatinilytica]|uniref:Phospholipase n=1 Tax=Inhella gelatinilytica TaxID=2795030 RepID=A0A931IYY4_9BURK|nr:patatin-like phospholipase family protein [Inhella gelatinilytica]MBH9553153.1 phospholipase [Inhella gelatinilytica]